MNLSRRQFLLCGAALATAPIIELGAASTPASEGSRTLVAAPARARLLAGTETEVWAYDAQVPGPLIRARVGELLDLTLENQLPQPTTLHWHGMRVPNPMDGVPYLTQAPVEPGGRFRYRFAARTPGTFWYHPHFRTAEQQDRGLHGVIVVADDAPPMVDRELLWVLDDWRLDGQASIVDDFGDLHDASHQGRFGNTATINGAVPPDLPVRAGERIRLRLVNVANAWIYGLDFSGHAPLVIAYDGHAVPPHPPPGGLVVVGPAQRVDLIIDLPGPRGARFEVVDRFYRNRSYKLLDLVYTEEALRAQPLTEPVGLPAPSLPEPDLERAERHQVRFTGGAMGGLESARFRGRNTGIRELARAGKVWAINGVVADRNDEPPALELGLGRSHVIEFVNETAFPHPVHLHGHPIKIIAVGGEPAARATWRDTLLLGPRSSATVALVADNPGRWMLHCHIPEHQEAGMMAVVSVE